LAATAAFALALAAPAAASAATVGFEGETLVFRAGAGEANFVVAYADTPGKLKLTEAAAPTDGRCTSYADYDYVECDAPSALRMELGDRDDHFGLGSDFPAGMPVEVYGGDGKDAINGYTTFAAADAQLIDGGPGDDKLDGHNGDDVVRGGPGNDEVIGGAGNDVVEGGDGNDVLKPDRYEDPGNDVVDGGPGFDQVEDWDKPGESFNPPVAISFDGAANDGRPGEADNVIGVEKVHSHVHGTFAGGPGDDEFVVLANLTEGDSTITGAGGNDRLSGHDYNEAIDGGAGDDRVEGGMGNDTLKGGPGRDQVFGDATGDLCGYYYCKIPFGNDVIDTRDGEQDTVDCGAGEDRLAADAIDVVAANCEQVDKSGSGGPGAEAPGKPGGLTGPSSYTRRALKRGVAFEHTCAAACTITVKLVGDKKTARKLGGKTIAAGKGSRATGGPLKVTARLTGKAKRRLGRLRKGGATLKVTVVDGGQTQRFAKRVKLNR
jgi:Ca2+-binding RTX toxin-like protein